MNMERDAWVLAVILAAMLILLPAQSQPTLGDSRGNSTEIHDSETDTSNEFDSRDIKPELEMDEDNGFLNQDYTYNFKLTITDPNKVEKVRSLKAQIIGYHPINKGQEIFLIDADPIHSPTGTENIKFKINPKNEVIKLMGQKNYIKDYKPFTGKIKVKLTIIIIMNEKEEEEKKFTYEFWKPEILYDIKPYLLNKTSEGNDFYYIEVAAGEGYLYSYHPYINKTTEKNNYENKTYPEDCTTDTQIGKSGTLKWQIDSRDRKKSFHYDTITVDDGRGG